MERGGMEEWKKVATFTAGRGAPSMQEERCGWQRVHQIVAVYDRNTRKGKTFHKL
jgi:hypothetical protein